MTRQQIGQGIVFTVMVAYFGLSLIGAIGNGDWPLTAMLLIPLGWLAAGWWSNRRKADEVQPDPAPAPRELVSADNSERG